jgi:pseudolysin
MHVVKSDENLNTALQKSHTQSFMNGTIYNNLAKDLNAAPSYIFTKANAKKILAQTLQIYQQQTGMASALTLVENNLIVYVDRDNIAHWAYLNSFQLKTAKAHAKPIYIVDASNGHIYQQWNDLKSLTDVASGGYGGNIKTGKISFDGLPKNLDFYFIQRDPEAYMCYLQNDKVEILSDVNRGKSIYFVCNDVDKNHNSIYWSADLEGTNDSYSPDNEAMFAFTKTQQMYNGWYGVPVYVNADGSEKKMSIILHAQGFLANNAEWFAGYMWFGDGDRTTYYPLVTLDVLAHEAGHAFTEQHANLVYFKQSGAINESFSDMSGTAAKYFVYGTDSWDIGAAITRSPEPLRYMDDPTKDCVGKPKDYCSIDNAKNYTDKLNVHFTSGVYNKFFYLLSTTANWSIPQAFKVMLNANMNYWTATSDFSQAACGAISSAKDLHLNAKAVIKAANDVGIDTSGC